MMDMDILNSEAMGPACDTMVGACNYCGSDVYGHRGPWFGTQLPPPDTCSCCGATRRRTVLRMTPMAAPTDIRNRPVRLPSSSIPSLGLREIGGSLIYWDPVQDQTAY